MGRKKEHVVTLSLEEWDHDDQMRARPERISTKN